MPKVTIMKGFPASGKSTLAKKQVADSGGRTVRINKDDIRHFMFPGVKHSGELERLVVQIRDTLIMLLLKRGKNVIIDDTNLHPKHEQRIRQIVGPQHEVHVIFMDVSVEECVRRNAEREGRHKIPEGVIYAMAKDWESWKLIDCSVEFKDPEFIEFIPGLPFAIMCDFDGTIAHMTNRSPYEWKKCIDDTPDEVVIELLRIYKAAGYIIIIMSGRDSECRAESIEWLNTYEVPFDHLIMRPEGDSRKDSIVKRELFFKHVRENFNVVFVLDDRNQVVDEWRQMGLKCLQVAEGNF